MKLTGKHIHDFIDALPGGNPSQYARLLNISTARIALFLRENRFGRSLVKQGKVRASVHGKFPSWANKSTERGLLTASDVPTNHKIVERVCGTIPHGYREDAQHMFAMLIQMTTGNLALTEAYTEIASPFVELAKINHEQELRLAGYSRQIAQLEQIVLLQERAIENRLLMRLPTPELV